MLFHSLHVSNKVANAAVIEQINDHLKLNVIFVVFLASSFSRFTVSKQQLTPTITLNYLCLKKQIGDENCTCRRKRKNWINRWKFMVFVYFRQIAVLDVCAQNVSAFTFLCVVRLIPRHFALLVGWQKMYNFAKNDGLCIIKFNLAQQLVQVKRAKKTHEKIRWATSHSIHEGEPSLAMPN